MIREITEIFTRRPVRRLLSFLVLAFAIVVLAGMPLRAGAGDEQARAAQDNVSQVGLVIRYEDGDIETACISYTEPVIYGDDVLQLAGIDLGLAADGRVCSIDGVGCGTNDCWCQCTDFNNCTYWAYYHMVNGAWQYSNVGATLHQVQNGTVEGWSWGKGNFVSAIEPPPYTFEQLCSTAGQATATPTLTPTATQQVATPATPQISFFQANPALVTAGACTTLQWAVSSADEVRLDGAPVAPQGQQQVCPTASRSYSLLATNAAGSQTRDVSVQVQPAGQPTAVTTFAVPTFVPTLPPGITPAPLFPTAGPPLITPQVPGQFLPLATPVLFPTPGTAGVTGGAGDGFPQPLPPTDSTAIGTLVQSGPVTATPAPTRTPFMFALPATSTPRPRTALGADGRPTPTPILAARADNASPRQGALAEPRQPRGDANPAATAESRAFRAALLPGYAAYLFLAACLAVMAVWVRRRRVRPARVTAERDTRRTSESQD